MRKKDFKRELISPNYRIDNNVMRRYMREVFASKEMIEQEIAEVESLIKSRCERYGIITMEDNLQCLRTGNGFELIEGGKQSLAYIREELNKYRQNFADDLTFWSEVEKDWDNLPYLLTDLNEIENFNLSVYLVELRLWMEKYSNIPKKKKMLVTMNSRYDEETLKNVYNFLKTTVYWAGENVSSRDFLRIFKTSSVDDIKKIRIRNLRGCKAFVRLLVDSLVGTFDAKIVNLCFCDEENKSLNVQIHNTASGKYAIELKRLLSKDNKVK